MPTYDHKCSLEECSFTWEDTYSIKKDPPTECPKCHQQTAKRMISLNGRGVVELSGQELVDSCVAAGKKIAQRASKDENLYANLLNPERYHSLQSQMDKAKKNR